MRVVVVLDIDKKQLDKELGNTPQASVEETMLEIFADLPVEVVSVKEENIDVGE